MNKVARDHNEVPWNMLSKPNVQLIAVPIHHLELKLKMMPTVTTLNIFYTS